MKKNTSCCIFHDLGGPDAMACDNYGRAGREPKDASLVNVDTERDILFGDLIEWDAYGNPEVEVSEATFEATDVPEYIVDFG